jgi:hypothetical protein
MEGVAHLRIVERRDSELVGAVEVVELHIVLAAGHQLAGQHACRSSNVVLDSQIVECARHARGYLRTGRLDKKQQFFCEGESC